MHKGPLGPLWRTPGGFPNKYSRMGYLYRYAYIDVWILHLEASGGSYK